MSQTETLNILNLRCERLNPRLGIVDVSVSIPATLNDEEAITHFKGATGAGFSVALPPKQTSKVLWIRNDTTQVLTLTQPTVNIVVDVDQGIMLFGGDTDWKVLARGSGAGSGASFFSQIAGSKIELDAPNTGIVVNDISLNGAAVDRSIQQTPLLADTTPTALPESDQMYQSSIRTGFLRQPIPDNENLNSALGFPANNPNLYQGPNFITSLTSWNITSGRRTNVVMAPGVRIAPNIGNTLAFEDRCFFDALQIRGRKVGNTYIGVLIPPELDRCNAKFHIHVEGEWQSTNGNNFLKTYILQYRGGALLRQLDLWDDERQNNTPFARVVSSSERFIVGQSTGVGEDILTGDEFEFIVENDIGSTNTFNLDLIQAHIEALPKT